MRRNNLVQPLRLDVRNVLGNPLGTIQQPTVRNTGLFNDTNEHGRYNQSILDRQPPPAPYGHVDFNNTHYGYTPLTLAIDYNNIPAINRLLQQRVTDVNMIDANDFTPLTLAIRHVETDGTDALEALLTLAQEKDLDYGKTDGENRDIIYYISRIRDYNTRLRVLKLVYESMISQVFSRLGLQKKFNLSSDVLGKIYEHFPKLGKIGKALLEKIKETETLIANRRIEINRMVREATTLSSSSSSSEDDSDWETIVERSSRSSSPLSNVNVGIRSNTQIPEEYSSSSSNVNVPRHSNTQIPEEYSSSSSNVNVGIRSNTQIPEEYSSPSSSTVASLSSMPTDNTGKREADREKSSQSPPRKQTKKEKKEKKDGGKRTKRKLRKHRNGSVKVLRYKTRRML